MKNKNYTYYNLWDRGDSLLILRTLVLLSRKIPHFSVELVHINELITRTQKMFWIFFNFFNKNALTRYIIFSIFVGVINDWFVKPICKLKLWLCFICCEHRKPRSQKEQLQLVTSTKLQLKRTERYHVFRLAYECSLKLQNITSGTEGIAY